MTEIKNTLYGKYGPDGRVIQEPQHCVISGVKVTTSDPRWRVTGTDLFVRYGRSLKGVTSEVLSAAVKQRGPEWSEPAKTAKVEKEAK